MKENVSKLEERVRLLSEQLAKSERRFARTRVVVGTAIALLAGSSWWLKMRVFKSEEKVAQSEQKIAVLADENAQIRAQLAEQSKLTAAILAKLEADGGESDKEAKLLAAQTDLAKERGVPLAELQKQLAEEGTNLTALLAKIEQLEKTPGQDLQALRELKRTALTKLGDAERVAIHYAKAVEYHRAAAALFDREKEPAAWVEANIHLCDSLNDDGKYVESTKLARAILPFQEKALGPDDLQTMQTVNRLAVALRELAEFDESEAYFRRDIEASIRTKGAEQQDSLAAAQNLAAVLESKGDIVGAEKLLRQTLKGMEKTLEAIPKPPL